LPSARHPSAIACARRSIQVITCESGSPASSTHSTPCIALEKPIAAISLPRSRTSASTRASTRIVARYTTFASCSTKSGCGVSSP